MPKGNLKREKWAKGNLTRASIKSLWQRILRSKIPLNLRRSPAACVAKSAKERTRHLIKSESKLKRSGPRSKKSAKQNARAILLKVRAN